MEIKPSHLLVGGLAAVGIFLLLRRAGTDPSNAAPQIAVALPTGASAPVSGSAPAKPISTVDEFGYDEATDDEKRKAFKSLYSVTLIPTITSGGRPMPLAVAPLLPGAQSGAAILAKENMRTDIPMFVLSQASNIGIFFMPATADVARAQAATGGSWKLFLRPLEAANIAYQLGSGFELPS